MADSEEVQEPEEAPEVTEPYESESARYQRVRAEAKAQAAVTMAAEAKKAQRAKDKRLKGAPVDAGYAEFLKSAAEVEQRINSTDKEV